MRDLCGRGETRTSTSDGGDARRADRRSRRLRHRGPRQGGRAPAACYGARAPRASDRPGRRRPRVSPILHPLHRPLHRPGANDSSVCRCDRRCVRRPRVRRPRTPAMRPRRSHRRCQAARRDPPPRWLSDPPTSTTRRSHSTVVVARPTPTPTTIRWGCRPPVSANALGRRAARRRRRMQRCV